MAIFGKAYGKYDICNWNRETYLKKWLQTYGSILRLELGIHIKVKSRKNTERNCMIIVDTVETLFNGINNTPPLDIYDEKKIETAERILQEINIPDVIGDYISEIMRS